MKQTISTAAAMFLLTVTCAQAQDGPVGIAFVQAPEQGSGVATGPNPIVAFERARAQCMESGAAESDCLRTNWCYPANWSIDIFAQHREGIHWHEIVCGLHSESAARATAEAICNMEEREFLIECSLVQLYDPTGNAMIEY
ncbi:MAG: hypothetical protein AAFR71_07490 [Pseudomonadota bacterium]